MLFRSVGVPHGRRHQTGHVPVGQEAAGVLRRPTRESFGERSPEPSIDGEDRKLVESFLRNHLPGIGNVFHEQQSCFYTMTTDENFIVDTLPNCPQVVVIAGLSGHGFKFTSVLGKIACELAMDGITKRDIDFLRWR